MRFRFGVLGAGRISNKFCDAVARIEGAEVVAIASKSMERAKAFAAANAIPAAYDDYTRMIEEMKVPMTMQMRDSDVVLCLDISSRQPLSRLYERRTMDVWQIRRLLEGIAQACEVAEQYLMDVDRILLAPEYIFVEPEQDRCRFAFGFEKETTFSEELSGLLCYLLDHISRDDYERGSVEEAWKG